MWHGVPREPKPSQYAAPYRVAGRHVVLVKASSAQQDISGAPTHSQRGGNCPNRTISDPSATGVGIPSNPRTHGDHPEAHACSARSTASR